MTVHTLPEAVERLEQPVYRPYQIARELLNPGMTVLDVGCGNAKVSEYLAESGAEVDGIEPSESRAAQADGRIRFVSRVPAGEPDPLLRENYDVVTFFDVLEHVPDPAAILAWAVGKLAPGGRIVAAVPNSAHFSFRWKVLRGDWTMEDWGLFDRTHIRFFDTRTMRALQPEGTRLRKVTFTTPGSSSGWRNLLLRSLPNLYALHGTMIWEDTQSQATARRSI